MTAYLEQLLRGLMPRGNWGAEGGGPESDWGRIISGILNELELSQPELASLAPLGVRRRWRLSQENRICLSFFCGGYLCSVGNVAGNWVDDLEHT